MSGPVVFIGFIFLIPSVLGMLFCALMLIGINVNGGEVTKARAAALSSMMEHGVPEGVINRVMDDPDLDTTQFMGPPEQLDMARYGWVKDATEKIRAANTGTGLASGFVIALGVACFVGGLLGWLLVMKKRVLQCSMCGAVINAS